MRSSDAIIAAMSSLDSSLRSRARAISRWFPLDALTALASTIAMLVVGLSLLGLYSALQAWRGRERRTGRRVAVIWDIENCCPPRTADLEQLVNSIREAAATMGEIESIRAFIVERRTASSIRLKLALSQLGVEMCEIENNVRKEVVDHSISFELGRLTTDAVLLISMDRDFSFALKELSARGIEVGVIGFSGMSTLPAHRRWTFSQKGGSLTVNTATMIDSEVKYATRTPQQLVRDFAPLLRLLLDDEEIEYDQMGRKLAPMALRSGRQKIGFREYLVRAQQAQLCVVETRGNDRFIVRGSEFGTLSTLVTRRPASPTDDPFHRLVAILRSHAGGPMSVSSIQPMVSKRWLRAAGSSGIGQYITAASNEGLVSLDGNMVSLTAFSLPSTPRPATPAHADEDEIASTPPSPVFTSTPALHSSPASSAITDLDTSLSPTKLTAQSLAKVPSATRLRTLSAPSRPLAHRLLSRTSSMGLSLALSESDRFAWSSAGSSHGATTEAGLEEQDDVE